MKKIVLKNVSVEPGPSYQPEEWLRLLESTTAWRPPMQVIEGLRRRVAEREGRRRQYARAA